MPQKLQTNTKLLLSVLYVTAPHNFVRLTTCSENKLSRHKTKVYVYDNYESD